MFNIGDYVTINPNGRGHYVFTAPGSTGHILSITPDYIRIKFDFLNGADKPTGEWTFSIDADHVSPYKEITISERVCNKIKQMEARQSLKSS